MIVLIVLIALLSYVAIGGKGILDSGLMEVPVPQIMYSMFRQMITDEMTDGLVEVLIKKDPNDYAEVIMLMDRRFKSMGIATVLDSQHQTSIIIEVVENYG